MSECTICLCCLEMCDGWLFTEFTYVSKTMFPHSFVTVRAVATVLLPPEFSVLPTEKKTVLVLMTDSSAMVVSIKPKMFKCLLAESKQTRWQGEETGQDQPTNLPTDQPGTYLSTRLYVHYHRVNQPTNQPGNYPSTRLHVNYHGANQPTDQPSNYPSTRLHVNYHRTNQPTNQATVQTQDHINYHNQPTN